jgi:hypothetical protein
LVLYNDDANIYYAASYPMSSRDLRSYIASFAGNGVDLLSWDLLVNGVCWFGSRVGPRVFEGPSEFPHYSVRHAQANLRHLIAQGQDPPKVVAEECNRHGMKMLAGIRMGLNRTSEERLRQKGGIYYNPAIQGLRGRTIDDVSLAFGRPEPGTRLDYSYPEVQELILAPLQEMAEEYPVDGVELNFIRGTLLFESDEAAGKAPILSDFIRRVRKILRRAALRRGRDRLLLSVRIPDKVEWCRQLGMDVETWIKEGLVDIVAPDQIHGINFNAAIEEFVLLCEGTACKVLPSLHQAFGGVGYSLANHRAAADNWYRQGASGVSTFNFYFWMEKTGTDLSWFKQLRDPSQVARSERIYPVQAHKDTLDDLYYLRTASLSFQKGEVGRRKVIGSPRIEALKTEKTQAKLRFKVKEWAWDDVLEVDLNGKVLSGLQSEYFEPSRRGFDSDLWPSYAFQVPLPPGSSTGELGFRLVRRSNIATDVEIKEPEIVLAGSA